jgi:hypothetical protein
VTEIERPAFFHRAMVRGVMLGCAIQLGVCALATACAFFVLNVNVYSDQVVLVRARWIVMAGSGAATAILIGVSLRLRRLHKLDKARGVVLSIPVAFALGLAAAAALLLLLVAMCGGMTI